jgi:protease-4
MTDSQWREDALRDIAEDPRAKALLVRFDSPGGTAVAGEELYLQLQKVAKNKPVVGVMRTLCASACYMASLGTDYVVARESTLTGSIGVLLQSVEVSRLVDKLGITPITITSGAMKDVPSMTEPFTPEQRKIVAETVTDVYNQFVAKIVAHRKMDVAHVRQLADGRVYTGAQALKLNLIDGIGGQDEALAWLEKERKIKAGLEIQEIKEEPKFDSLFEQLGSYANQKIFGNALVRLDGLVSIWHPSAIK